MWSLLGGISSPKCLCIDESTFYMCITWWWTPTPTLYGHQTHSCSHLLADRQPRIRPKSVFWKASRLARSRMEGSQTCWECYWPCYTPNQYQTINIWAPTWWCTTTWWPNVSESWFDFSLFLPYLRQASCQQVVVEWNGEPNKHSMSINCIIIYIYIQWESTNIQAPR